MKKQLLIAAFALIATTTLAQENEKTLYLIDGRPTTKESVDQLPPEAVKNMNVMRGIESVVLITTKANQPEQDDVVVVRYPKQTQSTTVKIDKQTDEVVIDEKLNGTIFRFHKSTSTAAQEGDPLIIVKKADGTVDLATSVGDVKPEDIKTISVYKGGEPTKQFEQYGDTSKGVIFIEMKQ